MKTKARKIEYKKLRLIVPVSLFAGVLNGLLGTGGGVIIVYLFRYLYRKYPEGGDIENAEKDSFASVVAVILPTSLISALTYAAKGQVYFDELARLIIPSLIGGMTGAYLTDKLDTRALRAVFTLLILYSGTRMILS